MPDTNNIRLISVKAPIATYTATYQINSGSVIAAGASVTQTITFTGLATTDNEFGIAPRDAVEIPKGLQLTDCKITATNTLSVTWKNTLDVAITPPSSATWACVVLAEFFR